MRKALGGIAAAAALLWVAPSALANAPNPIPGTTVADSVVTNPDGSHTVTVHGQWIWVYSNEPNCPKDKDGVGYNVAWFDGNHANPIGTSNSPNGVIYVGDKTDNIVHSLNNLDPANTDTAFPGVPISYFSHNQTNSTPTTTDANNWVSNCGTNGATGATGTWGPISHTYPAGDAGPFTLCPVFYDPHGRSQLQGGGKESVQDITAGGSKNNNDNSYEGNGVGANGNNCTQATVPIPSTPTPPPPPPPTPTGNTKAVCTVSTSTVQLHGGSGKHTRTFTVSVGSFAVKQVRFYVDGHLVATVRKSSHGKFSTQIDPRKYGFGAHHVTAKVSFSAPNCNGVVRHATFVRPKPAVVVPTFTG